MSTFITSFESFGDGSMRRVREELANFILGPFGDASTDIVPETVGRILSPLPPATKAVLSAKMRDRIKTEYRRQLEEMFFSHDPFEDLSFAREYEGFVPEDADESEKVYIVCQHWHTIAERIDPSWDILLRAVEQTVLAGCDEPERGAA